MLSAVSDSSEAVPARGVGPVGTHRSRLAKAERPERQVKQTSSGQTPSRPRALLAEKSTLPAELATVLSPVASWPLRVGSPVQPELAEKYSLRGELAEPHLELAEQAFSKVE
jgi:hypothetical protein